MSIDMYLTPSRQQSDAFSHSIRRQIEDYQLAQKALSHFQDSVDALKGQAYDGLRLYAQDIIQPLIDGGLLYIERAEKAIQRFPEAFAEEVSPESLKESDLITAIEQLNQLIATNEQLVAHISFLPILTDLDYNRITLLQSTNAFVMEHRDELVEKLEKLRLFHAHSPTLFRELESIESLLSTGLSQLSSWDPVTATYTRPENLTWAGELQQRYQTKDFSLEEQAYIENLKSQYGFDQTTALQILKLKRGIDKKFPDLPQEKRDYLLLRVLGGGTYNDSQWDHTAGDLIDYFYTDVKGLAGESLRIKQPLLDIFQTLGLSELEAKQLSYHLRLQHDMSNGAYSSIGNIKEDDLRNSENNYLIFKNKAESVFGTMTDKEFELFWDSRMADFLHKPDFTHQAITMSTHLYDKVRLADGLGFLRGYGLASGQHTNDLSGWLGDTTRLAGNSISLGPDDYKADLDAVNIVERMKQYDQTYLEASAHYYTGIELHKNQPTHPLAINRAEEFTQNIPIQRIMEAMTKGYQASFDQIISREELKQLNPVGEQFITDLENGVTGDETP